MIEVSVHEAKTHLSRLLDQVENGEEVVIRRHGKAVARLVGDKPKKPKPIPYGCMRGQIKTVEGWDRAMTDEEVDAFLEGRY